MADYDDCIGLEGHCPRCDAYLVVALMGELMNNNIMVHVNTGHVTLTIPSDCERSTWYAAEVAHVRHSIVAVHVAEQVIANAEGVDQ